MKIIKILNNKKCNKIYGTQYKYITYNKKIIHTLYIFRIMFLYNRSYYMLQFVQTNCTSTLEMSDGA